MPGYGSGTYGSGLYGSGTSTGGGPPGGYGSGAYGSGPYGTGGASGVGGFKRIDWDIAGERFFEAGVDQVVLYPDAGPGVPWNGVTAIDEDSSGGELEPLYFDGVKYADLSSAEDFSIQLSAFSSPKEFSSANGVKQLAPGLYVTQQKRKSFGLSYRTLKGNDLKATGYGYKIHIVYNCTAAPSGVNNQTISGNVTPSTKTWDINTVPPPSSSFRPSAHLVLDSTLLNPYFLEEIETMLYGRDASDGLDARAAYLPSVAEILSVMSNTITEFIEATI